MEGGPNWLQAEAVTRDSTKQAGIQKPSRAYN